MKNDSMFIHHILDEIDFVLRYTENTTFEMFLQNEILLRAVSRSIEIIGEASKNISDDYKQQHPDIEWKKLAGMRDKIIHHYFGVNWDIVWDIVTHKLSELKLKLK